AGSGQRAAGSGQRAAGNYTPLLTSRVNYLTVNKKTRSVAALDEQNQIIAAPVNFSTRDKRKDVFRCPAARYILYPVSIHFLLKSKQFNEALAGLHRVKNANGVIVYRIIHNFKKQHKQQSVCSVKINLRSVL
ncbi:MAG: hypothetical protein LBB81_08875, partial [Treponema sp.]|nr:hypothetical protein [Treponema sp.]